jgi:hypothetical protein
MGTVGILGPLPGFPLGSGGKSGARGGKVSKGGVEPRKVGQTGQSAGQGFQHVL